MSNRGACKVVLNIYDLSDQNNLLYWCGVGIFHTGVEVHGVEYAYGGHEYDASGIFATSPKDAPGPVTFRESAVVGVTELSSEEVQQLVHNLGQAYRGNRYHLLQRNCNHFASDLSYQLCGRRSPPWVNRLANLAVMLHCLLPTAWVPPLSPPTMVPQGLGERFAESDQQLLLGVRSSSSAPAYA